MVNDAASWCDTARMEGTEGRMTTFDMRHEGRTGLEMGLGTGPEHMQGWPYTDFATGWYVIGYSGEIKPGEVKPARWFNQDLVVFRTASGVLSVLDAYCPHMGAGSM